MSGLKKTSDWRQFDRVRPREGIDNEVSFRLEAGDREHRPVYVMDVSHFGAGLRMADALESGAAARLVMQIDNETHAVKGNIRWCRPEAPSADDSVSTYQVGLSFDPNDMSSNMMFFAVLSRYCHLT
jgi:hypothetical protein